MLQKRYVTCNLVDLSTGLGNMGDNVGTGSAVTVSFTITYEIQ